MSLWGGCQAPGTQGGGDVVRGVGNEGSLVPHPHGLTRSCCREWSRPVSSERALCAGVDGVRTYINGSSHWCHLLMRRGLILVCALPGD